MRLKTVNLTVYHYRCAGRTMPFEEVDYWEELTRIMDWTKTNVVSTLHLCWGAQAGMYYHYGIDKVQLDKRHLVSSGTEY